MVAAWGANGGLLNRDREVYDMLTDKGVKLWCLGTTKNGHPRHPLYVAKTTELVRYRGP